MRAVIVDSDGAILRTITGLPDQFGLQAVPGEAVFALTDGDEGQFLDDGRVVVSEDGALLALQGEAAPIIALQYVPS